MNDGRKGRRRKLRQEQDVHSRYHTCTVMYIRARNARAHIAGVHLAHACFAQPLLLCLALLVFIDLAAETRQLRLHMALYDARVCPPPPAGGQPNVGA